MLLAGMALPPIQLGGMGIVAVAAHVVLITIVSNIGKCLPMALTKTKRAWWPARGSAVGVN